RGALAPAADHDRLERAQPVDHLAQEALRRRRGLGPRRLDGHQVVVDQVAEQHPDHRDGQVQLARDLGDRPGVLDHAVQQPPVLDAQLRVGRCGPPGERHGRQQVERRQRLGGWLGASAGHRVRAHDRTGLLVDPLVLVAHDGVPPSWSLSCRPRCQPDCNEDSSALASSGERSDRGWGGGWSATGASGCGGFLSCCGRLAWRTRRGSPAPAADGAAVLRLAVRTRRGSSLGPGPAGGRCPRGALSSGGLSLISLISVAAVLSLLSAFSLPTTDTVTDSSSGGSGGRIAGSGWTRCEGTSTITVVPPYGEGLSVTLTPCRAASMPTTAKPSWSVCAGSNSGGLARRQLIASLASSDMPSPRSSISAAKPLPTRSPRTDTSLPGEEKVAA